MNVVFAGTPKVAVECLNSIWNLKTDDIKIVEVLTNPDAKVGRKKVLTSSEVKKRAQELDLSVVENPSDVLKLDEKPDLGVIVAYGKILKPEILAIPKYGWINLHFSLLPEYRGAAPAQRAIIDGKKKTGVSIFKLQAGLDDGPILKQEEVEILPSETSDELLERLSKIGAKILAEIVLLFKNSPDEISYISQNILGAPEVVTIAKKLDKREAKINWDLPAGQIVNHINGYSSNPGAWFELHQENKTPQRIVALRAKLNQEYKVELLEVKPAGKNRMPAGAWLNGIHGQYEFC
jgi:methionyl-tRNA formyltransferase